MSTSNGFADGTLNVSYNCLDRHLAERGDQAAIIWEAMTRRQPHHHLPRVARTSLQVSPTPCVARMCTAATW